MGRLSKGEHLAGGKNGKTQSSESIVDYGKHNFVGFCLGKKEILGPCVLLKGRRGFTHLMVGGKFTHYIIPERAGREWPLRGRSKEASSLRQGKTSAERGSGLSR